MKYTPEGGRGVALQVSHDRYRPGAIAEKFAAANRRSTLFCQIETAEGVKNADAIAALPGVDCLWVGHFDLSVSLGVRWLAADRRRVYRPVAGLHRWSGARP
jgi:2-keto-3-deoxy-L-rhamnonate aldolase RhmA